MASDGTRFCMKCGSDGPFPTPRAYLCVACTEKSEASRQDFVYRYHRARYKAVAQLIEEHKIRFKELMDIALDDLEKKAKAAARSAKRAKEKGRKAS